MRVTLPIPWPGCPASCQALCLPAHTRCTGDRKQKQATDFRCSPVPGQHLALPLMYWSRSLNSPRAHLDLGCDPTPRMGNQISTKPAEGFLTLAGNSQQKPKRFPRTQLTRSLLTIPRNFPALLAVPFTCGYCPQSPSTRTAGEAGASASR